MMIRNNQRLFLIERKIADKKCNQCGDKMDRHDVCFSKRKKHYYCVTCALSLGYIKLRSKEAFISGHLVGNT